MTTAHLPHTVTLAGPALRALWLLGLPLAAALWAMTKDRRLVAAALFAGAAAALIPAAMLETAMPVVITHSPGGGGEMIAFFWHGVRDLLLAGVAAGVALLLRRRALGGAVLPQGALAGLFALFYAAMIVPRHNPVSDALIPGLGGAADPLAPLVLLGPAATWLAALSLGAVVAIALTARTTG